MRSEFSQEITKAIGPVSPERVATMFQAVGVALFQSQFFESALVTYLCIAHKIPPDTSYPEAVTVLEKARRATLGSTLADLKKYVPLGTKTDELLQQFLKERNWLVHHLVIQNGDDARSDDRFPVLIERLNNIATMAEHLQAEFVKLTAEVARQRGITDAEIESATIERLKGP